MQFTYELSEQDFIEAYRAHRNRKTFTKWSIRILFWFVVATAAFGLIFLAIERSDEATKNLLPAVVLALLWIVLLRFLPRWNMKRQFRKQPAAHGLKTMSVDADGTHSRWDGGSGDVAWKNYIRWVEGKHQILLCTSPFYFVIISTRTLEPTQLAELRELLKQNIQSEK